MSCGLRIACNMVGDYAGVDICAGFCVNVVCRMAGDTVGRFQD